MLFHLAGEEGLRDKSAGFSVCAVCANSPDDIKEKAKLEMEAQSSKKVAKCASKISKANSIAEEGNMRADAQIAAGAKGVFGKNAAKINADSAVSDFFMAAGWRTTRLTQGCSRRWSNRSRLRGRRLSLTSPLKRTPWAAAFSNDSTRPT